MTATIGDVARRAGVGRGTVSRVLNNRPNVDPATRARVLEAIEELDYVPSATARHLSLGRTNTIAVIVPWLTRPSVVERLRGIEAALAAASLDMIVFNVETPERRDAVFRDLPRRDRVDGLIIASIGPRDADVERIRRTGLPVVLVDAHHRLLPRVITDDVEGGRLAARHLVMLGHRRIGFVGDIPRSPFNFSSSRLRLLGVQRVLRDAGIPMHALMLGLGEHGRQQAQDLAMPLLRRRDRPTAIIAASDTQALGVLEAADQLGLRVPADLSVIGYDDIEAADYLGLSTVHQPLFETGTRSVRRLLAAINGTDQAPLREVLPVGLTRRRTTGPAPASTGSASA